MMDTTCHPNITRQHAFLIKDVMKNRDKHYKKYGIKHKP